MLFKNVLDIFLNTIEKSYIPEKDFSIENINIFPYSFINNLFINEYKRWPFHQRINEIKKHLKTGLKNVTSSAIESIERSYSEKIENIKSTILDEELI